MCAVWRDNDKKGIDLPCSEVDAVMCTATQMGESACPVCETAANSSAGYFARAFGESHRLAATSEAVTDALGFCPRHGAALLSQEGVSRGIVRVFRNVIPGVMPLLVEKHICAERYQRIFFAARTACPACVHIDRMVARHIARLARQLSSAPDQTTPRHLDMLCVTHMQLLAEKLKAKLRLAALAHYVDDLDDAASAMDIVHASEGEMAAGSPHDEEAMRLHALNLVAGRTAAESNSVEGAVEGALADALHRCPTLAAAIADANVCPLCIERARISQRWIQNVLASTRHAEDAWLFFPTCPEHIGAVARLGYPELTSAVATHALHIVRRQLRQRMLILIREAELRAAVAAARAAQRYKYAKQKTPKPPHLQTPKPAAPQPLRCPGCERLGIAEAHARGKFLDLLEKEKHRIAFGHGYGLCMKHFAEVYMIAPKSVVRSTLAEDQRGRLAEFARMLDEAATGHAKKGAGVSQAAPWRLELHRFCGFT